MTKSIPQKLLESEKICFLGTADRECNPHVKPIWFVCYKGDIWFETHLPTKSYKNIQENNKVCLCFGGRDTYIVWGTVEEFTEKTAEIPFRKLCHEKYGTDMEDDYFDENTRYFKVHITKQRAWKYAPTWEDIKL